MTRALQKHKKSGAAAACVLLGLWATPAALAEELATPAAAVTEKRAWGPEQAAGPPDTPQAGDMQTAWASASQDGQQEWLELQYRTAVVPKAVLVYETYNPGALRRVSVFKTDGTEVEVFSGKDPTPPGKGKGISAIPIKFDHKISRVKIYLDSPAVQSWNEIDAVGLRDAAGNTQWATTVKASSTYAERQPAKPAKPTGQQQLQQRVKQLEDENRNLKKMIEELTAELKAKQGKE